MAGPAESPANKSLVPVESTRPGRTTAAVADMEKDRLMKAIAKLYGHGFSRRKIMLALLDDLAPAIRPGQRDRTQEEREQLARRKLRQFEDKEEFRDLVYEHGVKKLDLDLPKILEGVGRKGKAGRVDAARLALEVTGRHNPKGEQQAPNVTVQIANIPRPLIDPSDD